MTKVTTTLRTPQSQTGSQVELCKGRLSDKTIVADLGFVHAGIDPIKCITTTTLHATKPNLDPAPPSLDIISAVATPVFSLRLQKHSSAHGK